MIKTDTELLSKVEELKYKILHNLNKSETTENININEEINSINSIITDLETKINDLEKSNEDIQNQLNNLKDFIENYIDNYNNLDYSSIDLSSNQSIKDLVNKLFDDFVKKIKETLSKENFQDYKEIKIIKEINKEDLFNGELNGEELSNAIVIDTDITDYLKDEEVSEYLLSYDIIKKEGFTFDDFVFNIFTIDNSDFIVLLNDSFVSTMDGLKDIEDEIFLSIYIDINFIEQIVDSFGKPVVKIFISFISIK
jgi:vacuolar-type H+-ATPase subunit I/STV1